MEYDLPSGTYSADFVVTAPFTSSIQPPHVAGGLDIHPNPASSVLTVDFEQDRYFELIILQGNS